MTCKAMPRCKLSRSQTESGNISLMQAFQFDMHQINETLQSFPRLFPATALTTAGGLCHYAGG